MYIEENVAHSDGKRINPQTLADGDTSGAKKKKKKKKQIRFDLRGPCAAIHGYGGGTLVTFPPKSDPRR